MLYIHFINNCIQAKDTVRLLLYLFVKLRLETFLEVGKERPLTFTLIRRQDDECNVYKSHLHNIRSP